MIPFLDLKAPHVELRDEINTAIARVVDSGWYILGPEVDAFESEYAAYCEASHCIGLANGLDALHLALRAMDVGPGDEVIVPSNTYIATWLAVSQCGATPVPVEPDARTYNIDPAKIEAAITDKTRAIMPVSLYGQCADMDPINAIAMVRWMVTVLGETDPAHQTEYARNGAALVERLERLNQQLASDLAPVGEQPYLVFHDAYHYFERRYGLNAVGSVVLDPERRPGAKRVAEIQARVRERKVRCVFGEPQFQPTLVETVIAGGNARRGVLDPLGADLPAGPDAYFQLLQGLSEALRGCLAGA